MSKIIEFNNICKDFKISVKKKGNVIVNFFRREHKTIEALKNVSFDVHRGESVGIIGTNGSGKSTILKIIT